MKAASTEIPVPDKKHRDRDNSFIDRERLGVATASILGVAFTLHCITTRFFDFVRPD